MCCDPLALTIRLPPRGARAAEKLGPLPSSRASWQIHLKVRGGTVAEVHFNVGVGGVGVGGAGFFLASPSPSSRDREGPL